MLEYGGTISGQSPALASAPADSDPPASPLGGLIRLALGHWLIIALFALIGAISGVIVSKTLPPKYVAVAQIYLDPRGMPGADNSKCVSLNDGRTSASRGCSR